MRRFNFRITPTYSRAALPVPQSPAMQLWIMVPAIALAAMTFGLVWGC